MKIIISYTIVFLLTSFVFLSCDFLHETVTNQAGFEPARFSWEFDTIYGSTIRDGWYYDSSSIYLMDDYGLLIYDGSDYEIKYWTTAFGAYCISGYDESNVYIGGITYNNMAMMLKWDGSSFTDYIVTDTAEPADYFCGILAMGRDDVWLGGRRGKVYRFNGSNYQSFNFDTSYRYIMPFITDDAGNLYFTGKIFYGEPWVDSVFVEFHKYDNVSWSVPYRRMKRGGSEYFFYPQNAGTDIIAVGNDILYEFNGSDFLPSVPMANFLGLDVTVKGTSVNDFITIGYDYQTREDYLFHWNGISWSRECGFYRTGLTMLLYCSVTTVFAASVDYQRDCTYLYKGRRL